MSVNIRISEQQLKMADNLLAKIPVEIRARHLDKALKAVADMVVYEAQRRVPIGDPKHQPEKKALSDTIGYVVRKSSSYVTIVVGAQYPAGSHAHLVEGYRQPKRIVVVRGPNKGKDTGYRAAPKEFMAPAVDITSHRHEPTFARVLQEEVGKTIKRLDRKAARALRGK